MDTCRYHTPHINTLEHEGYEHSEEFEYISGEQVPICSAPSMQQPGKVVGCAYALEQPSCPAYEADRTLLRQASDDDRLLQLHTLRAAEGVRAFEVSQDDESVVFSVHEHGEDARTMADERFETKAEQLGVDEDEVEDPDITTSYLEKVLA